MSLHITDYLNYNLNSKKVSMGFDDGDTLRHSTSMPTHLQSHDLGDVIENDVIMSDVTIRPEDESKKASDSEQVEKLDVEGLVLAPSSSTLGDEEKGKSEIANKFDARTSPWASLWLCNFVQFVCGIQMAIYFTSLWPYLSELEPGVSFSFLGVIVAVFSLGQTVASPIFGYWSDKSGSTKIPSAFGLLISAIGNLIYALLPSINGNVKWYMLLARILVGLGTGNLGVLRAYTSTASVDKDRNKAMALSFACIVFGQCLGPAVQAMFSPIGNEGIWLGAIKLNMYTAPAYGMIVLSAISIFLLFFCFTETYAGIIDSDEKIESNVRLPHFDKLAAAILIYMWYLQQSMITNVEIIAAPLTIAMFEWNDSQAVLYNGLITTSSFLYSIGHYLAIAYTRVGKIDSRKMMLVSLVMFLVHYLINMPWPFYHNKMQYISGINGSFTDDTTLHGGCYQRYSWCTDTTKTPIYLYVFSTIFIYGAAFPYFATPSGTLYSQVLGPRNQGFMQGILAFFGSLARIALSLVASNLFERYGYIYPNLIQLLEALLALMFTAIFYRRLIPLRLTSTNERLHSA